VPSIADVGGVPYVAWQELISGTSQIVVKHFDGSTWTQVASSLNFDATRNAERPSIASVASTAYVAWDESSGTTNQLYVKRFDGIAWMMVGGGSLNFDATRYSYSANMASIGGTPLVGWQEHNGTASQIRVRRFNGSNWTLVGGSLNLDPAKGAFFFDPSITDIGGVPYVTFQENDVGNFQIRVERLEPDVLSESATPTPTGATLSAQLNDYGVPLPVGFEFGPSSAFGGQTALQSTAGDGVSTVTQTIAGLTPATTYLYRAFGSDGVRETSRGATQSFMTLALPPPPTRAPMTNATLSALSETNSVFAVGAASTPLSAQTARRHARGTTFSFRLDQAATVKLAIQAQSSGRRVHGRCLPNSRGGRRKPRCTRMTTVAILSRGAHGGLNKVAFSGRISGKALKPGRYQAVFTPIDNAGASVAQTLGFKIVKH
jgi:hypothetical protein